MKTKKLVLQAKVDTDYWEKNFPEERGLTIQSDKTGRGFLVLAFDDLYGQKCSLQNSSLATEGAIWLGVDNTGPQLTGPSGSKNEEVGARMHLTRKQVEQILPSLLTFVEKGYIPSEND